MWGRASALLTRDRVCTAMWGRASALLTAASSKLRIGWKPLPNARAPLPSNLLTVNEADAAILTRAKSGNREAFRTIVERHSAGVFRVAYRLTRSEQDAEDVVQETFLKAYAELRELRGPRRPRNLAAPDRARTAPSI